MTEPARIGVVLAGGRATRMGGDKAGAVAAGRTLLTRAVEVVCAAGLEPRVCVRSGTALPDVPDLTPDAIWREPARAAADAAHPLFGLAHAVHTAGEPIVVLPVDLPLLEPAVLRTLAECPDPLAVLGTRGRPAALVARVTPHHAPALARAAAANAPALRTLVDLGAAVVDVDQAATSGGNLGRMLTNVNTPDDVAMVERLLRDR